MKVLTFNAAMQDVRILGRSWYAPLGFVSERLDALAHALAAIDADLVCLQELFHRANQDALYARLADRYPYALGFAPRGPKLRLGNELLTLCKYPLAGGKLARFHRAMPEERVFTSQGAYRVMVALPDGDQLVVVNLHASAGGMLGHPESPRAEAIRAAQVRQVLELADDHEPALLVGDLNAGPEASAANYAMLLEAGWRDGFSEAGAQGVSWDPANPLVVAGGESHLAAQRIDHVFLNPSACAMMKPVSARIVLHEPRVVLPDGRRVPISDHYGVLVSFTLYPAEAA